MSGERILVVDDSLDVRELLTAGLRGAGYDVLTAGDGEEALLIAETMRPALLIVDIMMPTMSGWELLREIRKDPDLANLKVMTLTAIGETVNEMTAEVHGADAHMDKPFAFVELLSKVSELLGP